MLRAKLAAWRLERTPSISNSDPLALLSGRGGPRPGVFADLGCRASTVPPLKPGPQPHNGGITPGFQVAQPDGDGVVTRREFRDLDANVDEIAAVLAKLLKQKGVTA